ncbi:CLUMA_CG012742, isoform A [Clunio marinus]|uniref:CLUMA_CG012742, isoform A n=1 Tax=Clunio marinus TaxID=568069 RepID=A0A1J1ILB0_9DIPT|nr:CLUMA_CG012742, isoform A [Clunio marinus]
MYYNNGNGIEETLPREQGKTPRVVSFLIVLLRAFVLFVKVSLKHAVEVKINSAGFDDKDLSPNNTFSC